MLWTPLGGAIFDREQMAGYSCGEFLNAAFGRK